MRATGIVRRIDNLGRVVLPKELRKTMNLQEGTPMEIYTHEDMIILKQYKIDTVEDRLDKLAQEIISPLAPDQAAKVIEFTKQIKDTLNK